VNPGTRIRQPICFEHGGQGKSLEPPYTCESVFLSITGASVKAWCLLIPALYEPEPKILTNILSNRTSDPINLSLRLRVAIVC